jgi:hypothetical protein
VLLDDSVQQAVTWTTRFVGCGAAGHDAAQSERRASLRARRSDLNQGCRGAACQIARSGPHQGIENAASID